MDPDGDPPLSPTPPTNVRVVYRPLGPVIPCDVIYDGLDGDIHVWLVTAPVPFEDLVTGRATVKIGMLPAKTAVSFTSTC